MSNIDPFGFENKAGNDTYEKWEVLNKLTDNGFDFLKKAIEEFQDEPKYSIIHFCSGLEIFIKARLFMDDWRKVMVLKNDKEAIWQNLVDGKFHSVQRKDAINRINRINKKEGITATESKLFEALGEHRNKLVHFYSVSPESESLDNISSSDYRLSKSDVLNDNVKLMLRCWYVLDYLLTNRWEQHFQYWNNQVVEIRDSLSLIKDYLRVKAEELKPEIELEKAGGVEFLTCPSCSFDMLVVAPESKPIFIPTCRLCNYVGQVKITIGCDACRKGSLEFIGEGYGECDKCGIEMEPDALLTHLVEPTPYDHNSPENNELANCGQCSGSECVVPVEEKFLCTRCFVLVDGLEQCDYCGAFNIEIQEASGLYGCSACDGKDLNDLA